MRSTVSITLVLACLLITSSTDGWPLNQAGGALVPPPRLDRGDRGQPHHRAVGATHHDRVVVRRGAELIIGRDGDRPLVAVEQADRTGGVGIGDGGGHR